MIARKLINYLLQRKLIGVPNYLRYHLMVLTKDRNSIQRIEFILILLMTNITLLGVLLFTISVTIDHIRIPSIGLELACNGG